MATNYPEEIDILLNPNSSDPLSAPSHSQQHANANDAIVAIQEFVGVSDSEDEGSLSYKVKEIEQSLTGIGNSTDSVLQLLGLEGNNDLVVHGIENKTAIDSFDSSLFRTIRYVIQISKENEHVSEEFNVVYDGTNMNVEAHEVSSNTTNILATTEIEKNSGIISLYVTPISGSVTARFYRTALRN
jgi:hypothetical protein